MKKTLSPVSIYSYILVSIDILSAIGGMIIGLWLTGWSIFLWNDAEAICGLIILALAFISFFPTYQLYSYHTLFSKKEHLVNLAKSYCWSLAVLCVFLFLINMSTLLTYYYYQFLALLLFGTGITLLVSRYKEKYFLNFLMALGLAIFFVGMTGLACKSGIPIFMQNTPIIISSYLIAAALLAFNRIILVHAIYFKWLRKHFRRQVIIVGSETDLNNIVEYILAYDAPFYVVGTVGAKPTKNLKQEYNKKHLGKIEELATIVDQHNITDIIITDETIDKPVLFTILDFCTSTKLNAWFSPNLLPIIDVKLFIDKFCGLPMILLCSQKNSWIFNIIKSFLDTLLSLSLTFVLAPILILLGLAIKYDSKGPVFYRPRAIGKDGQEFLMYKFRSMREDSENTIHKNYVSQLIKGEISQDDDKPLKITDDPRVTKVGKFIRKYSLDELPQLFNVLQRSMSLVGPRPCLPYEFEIYQEWYKKRTVVKPGITGLWQITGRSEVAFEDMILLDFYYIYNRSLTLDFNILFETIFVVLGKKGGF